MLLYFSEEFAETFEAKKEDVDEPEIEEQEIKDSSIEEEPIKELDDEEQDAEESGKRKVLQKVSVFHYLKSVYIPLLHAYLMHPYMYVSAPPSVTWEVAIWFFSHRQLNFSFIIHLL